MNLAKIFKKRWHLFYYVIAAFDLLAILFTVYMNHVNLQNYSDVLKSNKRTIEVLNSLAELQAVSQRVNTPGNDVFETLDHLGEKERFLKAKNEFDEKLIEFSKLLSHSSEESSDATLKREMVNSIKTSMDEMFSIEFKIFQYFEVGDQKKAGSLMAAMDRSYGKMLSEINELRNFKLSSQNKLLNRHKASLESSQDAETIYLLIILLGVLAVAIYGSKISSFVKEASHKDSQLAGIVVNSTDAIISEETNGTITSWNRGAENMFGFSSIEVIGKTMDLIKAEVTEEGQGIKRYKSKSGQIILASLAVSHLKGPDGMLLGFSSIIRDVTGQKLAEDQLKEAQSIAKIGSWSYDFITGNQIWSQEHYAIFEIQAPQTPEILHKLYRERIHPNDIALLDQCIQNALKHGKDYVYNHRVYLDQGTRIKYVQGIGKVQKDLNGNTTGITGTCQDLTRIIDLEEQSRFVLDSMGIGVWRFNPIAQDLFWDSSMYKLYELNENDFTKHSHAWESALSKSAKEKVQQELHSALTGEKEFNTTFEIITKSGMHKHIGAKGVIVKNDKNEPIMMYGINWDKTQETIAESNLQIARSKSFHNAKLASLGEMSAGVAHEINNPLAIIVGNIELLSMFKNDEVKFQEKVGVIRKSADRIVKIVNGLKKFSRISGGTVHKIESLSEIINESLIITDAKIKRHACSISIDVPSDLYILCDDVEIEQVVVNLINNAIDAIKNDEDRFINITGFIKNDKVVLQFLDSGSGIPLDLEAKLFQPFFTTKGTGEGTGLGLSITKGILDQHNATITLNRSFENTCFELQFLKVEKLKNEA